MFKIFLLLFMVSCSSSSFSASDWSDWRRCGVEQDDMIWDWCKKQKYGEKYHNKGLCYRANLCRTRVTMWPFRNIKTQTKSKMLFCPWPKDENDTEALQCMNDHEIFTKVIMTEPK